MKRFVYKLFIFAVAPLLLSVVSLYLLPSNPDNYLLAYDKKIDLLKKESTSPRVILVGGSSLAFGIDSRLIEEALQMNIVNYGLFGGLGLKYMIDDISSYVRDNDILIIALEYSSFLGNSPYGDENFSALIYLTKNGNFDLLNIKQKLIVLKDFPYILRLKINYTIDRLKKNTSKKEILSLSKSGFNEYGDFFAHWDLPNEKYVPVQKFEGKFNYRFGKYFIKKVQKLKTKCTVLIIPPVITKNGFNTNIEHVDALDSFLSNNNLPFLISPQAHVVPDDYAFHSDFHVNRKGVDFYTHRIIEELKEILP